MLHHEVTETELSITEDGTPILTYCYGDLERPPYFHPLYTPNGQVVTEGAETRAQYPPGVCFTLGTLNGEQLQSAATHARADTVYWRVPQKNSPSSRRGRSQEPILIATLTTKVHPRQTEAQVIDIEIALHAPTSSLEFAGNMGVGYYAVEMEYRRAMNADGRIGESEVDGHVSVWGTLCGITATEQEGVGVAIFPHPTNASDNIFRRGRIVRIPLRTSCTFYRGCWCDAYLEI